MKKTIAILTGLVSVAAIAGSITTSNEMGVLAVDPASAANGKMMLAIPYENYGATGNAITLSDIIATSFLAEGDKLYVANAGGYDVYTLSNTGSWTPSTKVTVDATGALTVTTTPSAELTPIARGQAVWLETSKSSIFLLGQVPAAAASVSVTGGGDMFKYNLVGQSTPTAVTLSSTFGANGDWLVLADGTTYARNKDTWKKVVKNDKTTTLVDAAGTTLPIGTGFWYLAKGEGTKTLSM